MNQVSPFMRAVAAVTVLPVLGVVGFVLYLAVSSPPSTDPSQTARALCAQGRAGYCIGR